MRMKGLETAVVLVQSGSAGGCVEVRIGGGTPGGATIARLTSAEARRLAAHLLFQSTRLDRPRVAWAGPSAAASMPITR